MQGNIITVTGGQWGSEAKGLAIETLTKRGLVNVAVRTGALNAGHTVYHNDRPYAMQLVPCPWIDPRVELVLGAGCYLNKEQLEVELGWIRGSGQEPKLHIDWRCGAHTNVHKEREAGLHEKMGSTGKGCSEALIDRIRRRKDECPLFKDTPDGADYEYEDTVNYLHDAYDAGKNILLEGTQGTMLDFYLADWPYVTARQTHTAAWLAEAGLSPRMRNFVVLVMRTYPIRVAGNSGPMPGEISWADLARRYIAAGKGKVSEEDIVAFEQMEQEVQKEWDMPIVPPHMYPQDLRETFSEKLVNLHKEVLTRLGEETTGRLKKLFELTTVTKKLRRIAEMEEASTKWTIRVNRPDVIFLNFLNYACPQDEGVTDYESLSLEAKTYITRFEGTYGVKVGWVSTGPQSVIELPGTDKLLKDAGLTR